MDVCFLSLQPWQSKVIQAVMIHRLKTLRHSNDMLREANARLTNANAALAEEIATMKEQIQELQRRLAQQVPCCALCPAPGCRSIRTPLLPLPL